MAGFFDGLTLGDIWNSVVDLEKAKVQARLGYTEQGQAALGEPARSQNPQARPYTDKPAQGIDTRTVLIVGGLGLAALVAWKVIR